MKKVFCYIIIMGIMLIACENMPKEFPDYFLKAVYFPVQLPLRTLSLGEDRIDNSLDREFRFDIGVSIGGMYENKKDWTVDFVIDTSLTARVFTKTSLKIKSLPAKYYTLNPSNTVIIPKGEFNGLIRIQLSDGFFDDTLSITGQYVVPLRITNTSADSILMGKPAITSPDPRIKEHWEFNKSPKNWTMYGIKYVNAYHGTYLHRGRDVRIVTATGVPFDTVIFRNPYGYVEKDPLIKLTTVGRRKVITNGLGNKVAATHSMMLEFEDDFGKSGNVKISPVPGKLFSVTGTGKYYDIASSTEQWTGKKWQSMYLNYTYTEGIYTHQINDTLVFRDRGIKYEENSIVITP